VEDERQRRETIHQAGEKIMSATHVVVEGTPKPDGSLELDSKPNLPPGRVQLIVQPLPELPKDDPFWQERLKDPEFRKIEGFPIAEDGMVQRRVTLRTDEPEAKARVTRNLAYASG